MSEKQHSVVKWIEIIGGLAGVLAVVVGMSLYLQAMNSKLDAQGRAMTAAVDKLIAVVEGEAESKRDLDASWIEADQGEHKRLEERINDILMALDSSSSHMAALTVTAGQIEKAQSSQFSQRESRFEELENEHKWILAGIRDSYAGVIEILLFLSAGGEVIPQSPPLNKPSFDFRLI